MADLTSETVTSPANLCGHWQLHGGRDLGRNASGSFGLTLRTSEYTNLQISSSGHSLILV